MTELIPPVPPDRLQPELTDNRRILTVRGLQVFLLTGDEAPNCLREIGRIREREFRAVGAGRGLPCDTDDLDSGPYSYRHLVVWDPENREIVAAYRYILCGDLQIPPDRAPGWERLRTARLFAFGERLQQDYLPSAIELGRSVVNKAARKSLMGLFCTWAGLGALMHEYAHIRYYFGNFSLYNTYPPEAVGWILRYLGRHHYESGLLEPREAVSSQDHGACRPAQGLSDPIQADPFTGNREDDWDILNDLLRRPGLQIPPILQTYIGACPRLMYLGTAADPDFGDALECAILVPRDRLHPRTIQRFFDGYRSINPQRFLELRRNSR